MTRKETMMFELLLDNQGRRSLPGAIKIALVRYVLEHVGLVVFDRDSKTLHELDASTVCINGDAVQIETMKGE